LTPRPNKFRFYLDENFPAPAGKFLRSEGHNVIEVVNLPEHRSKSDFEQINVAVKDERILVALDKDFLVDKNLENAISKSLGVLLINSSDPCANQVIKILKKVLKSGALKSMKGKLCVATIDKIDRKEIIHI